LAGSALAIDFENPPYNGSAGGTLLTGQDGWYNPVVGSTDWSVFTYAGNTMGVSANPAGGGDQFAGVISQGGAAFGRAQKDFDFGSAPGFDITYDVNHQFLGILPATQNLASWSLQPSATNRSIQDLHVWDDLNTAASWSVAFLVAPQGGGAQVQVSPGVEWTGLQLNHWYRISHTIEFVTNRMTRTSLTDLHTNTTFSFNPTDWYMTGGEAGTLPMPTSYRFFAGVATAGNAMDIDNFTIDVVPEPGPFIAIGAGLALLVARRRRK
jgi:hypothetical protein